MTFKIYTDGSCHGNPGPGGWAFIVLKEDLIQFQESGSMKNTTNNQMELSAAIKGIEYILKSNTDSNIKLFTDSKYVIDGINSWIHGWKKNNWKTASRQPVKNIELWKQLDDLVKRVTIEWVWVKGHSGEVMNEKVDQLANSAALRGVS